MSIERKDDGSIWMGIWMVVFIILAFIAGNRLRDLGWIITIQPVEHNQNQEDQK